MMRKTVAILGTPIDVLDTSEVLEKLEQFIQEGRFHQIATANTDFLINAVADPELRHILRHADLVVPDGMPVVWASRMLGSPLPERVTGVDIVPRLAELSARKGYRIYMVGALPEVIKEAKKRLEKDHPGLQIVGCVSPPAATIVEMDSEALLADIAHTAPDILLVAFGNPKQEKWIHLHRDRLKNVPVCIGVGGTFDMIAGRSARAPRSLQRFGFEWIYRLLQDPKRLWRRYARDLAQGSGYMFRQWWILRRQNRTGASQIFVAHAGEWTFLSLVGDFNTTILPRFRSAADAALDAGRHIVLDFGGVASVDTEALGALIELLKCSESHHQEVRLAAAPGHLTKTLRWSEMNDLFAPTVLANALTDPSDNGLNWHVQCSKSQAMVTVKGISTQGSAYHFEQACTQLLAEGMRLEIDARGITYADSHLLTLLRRLQRLPENCSEPALSKPILLQLVAGNTLYKAMQRENMLSMFHVQEAPGLPDPQDAIGEQRIKAEEIDGTEMLVK